MKTRPFRGRAWTALNFTLPPSVFAAEAMPEPCKHANAEGALSCPDCGVAAGEGGLGYDVSVNGQVLATVGPKKIDLDAELKKRGYNRRARRAMQTR